VFDFSSSPARPGPLPFSTQIFTANSHSASRFTTPKKAAKQPLSPPPKPCAAGGDLHVQVTTHAHFSVCTSGSAPRPSPASTHSLPPEPHVLPSPATYSLPPSLAHLMSPLPTSVVSPLSTSVQYVHLPDFLPSV